LASDGPCWHGVIVGRIDTNTCDKGMRSKGGGRKGPLFTFQESPPLLLLPLPPRSETHTSSSLLLPLPHWPPTSRIDPGEHPCIESGPFRGVGSQVLLQFILGVGGAADRLMIRIPARDENGGNRGGGRGVEGVAVGGRGGATAI